MSINDVFFPRKPASYDEYDGVLDRCVWLGAEGQEAPVLCALSKEQPRFAIVYLHGNYEDLGEINHYYQHEMKGLIKGLNAHFLAVEYPGYGLAPAVTTTPERCVDAAWDCITFVRDTLKVPHDRIIVYGRSIGTGVAIALSGRMHDKGCPPHAVILQSPFSATSHLVKHHAGTFASYIVSERFNSVQALSRITNSAIFMVHGLDDDIIPSSHTDLLAETACKHGIVHQKLLVSGDHNRMGTKWYKDAETFICGLPTPSSSPPPALPEAAIPYGVHNLDLGKRGKDNLERSKPGFFEKSIMWSISKLTS